jgi:histidyl-tRNA synthetase
LYSAPRGTTDILPADQPYWRYVEQKAAQICQVYGYQRIDVPIFEDTGLFIKGTGDTTDIVQKEMYTFNDLGGNSLTLKPEGTPSACRAYLEHGMNNLPQPVKLYYFSPMFRYDRPQAGRYRQFVQLGVEAIGEGDCSIDAEVIELGWRFLTSMGLRKLKLYINSIGCPQCRPNYHKKLREYYASHIDQMCGDCENRIDRNVLRLLDCKNPVCQPYKAEAPKSVDYLCVECDDHFQKLQGYLKMLDIPYEVDPYIVRGLDYYSRTVFEIQPEEEKSQTTIVGGGRYDGLIETLGGKPTPGMGFATGFERIILNIKKEGIQVPPIPSPRVYIAFLGEEARPAAIKLSSDLRQKGIGVVVATSLRSLKSQLRHANNLGIPKTVIIGEDEVKAGIVVVRDMATSQQSTVKPEELPELLA